MEKVIKYKCEHCGDLFNTPQECEAHESRHIAIETANALLRDGKTLQEIQEVTGVWYRVPEHLKDVNKDNCFTIRHWQCCEKPAYQMTSIFFDGRVNVRGCGSWSGYYGRALNINDDLLNNPRPKEELFVDSRYGDIGR